jgi:cellulose synthase/poly-beta-1,6-N-acetylglucosamine synthase-like glycosyltransferase
MLVAPFADPEVGASMGRVVPHNIGDSLLSGLLSLERSAGYQGVQQSRFNLGFTAQFGGTVGAVRASALASVGGWNPESLTEDTDLTFALLLNGWKTAYVNRAECYEEVPQSWSVRRRQLSRWVTGHTECLHNYWPDLMRSRFLSAWEKLDALFLLAMYWTAPILVLGWVASLLLFFIPEAHHTPILPIALAFLGYQMFSNQATFLEIGVASMLDGTRVRSLLLPLNLLNFFANTGAICNALRKFYWNRFWGSGGDGWYKTHRTRGTNGGTNFGPGSGAVTARSATGLYHAPAQGD